MISLSNKPFRQPRDTEPLPHSLLSFSGCEEEVQDTIEIFAIISR